MCLIYKCQTKKYSKKVLRDLFSIVNINCTHSKGEVAGVPKYINSKKAIKARSPRQVFIAFLSLYNL